MKSVRTFLLHLVAFLALPGLALGLGLHERAARDRPGLLPPASEALLAAPRPPIDPTHPTVVVLLGADLTEVTDFLGPYEIFSRVGGLDVVTAAPERRPTRLTGGLTVLPHYALAELEALLPDGPEILVVPNVPNVAEPMNRPLVDYVVAQARAGRIVHSWCKGAMTLAETGLLEGRRATAHWGDLAELERRYPGVRWERGVRWVEDGPFLMSAGITSGIDASLHLVSRLWGSATARRVAGEIRYRDLRYVDDAAMEPIELEPADYVLALDAAFAERVRIGLGVYPGVGELDLSNVYDTHAYTMVADVVAIAERGPYVESEHGLTLVPAATIDASPAVDRFVVPGGSAGSAASTLVAGATTLPTPTLLHAGAPERFGLELALDDLARTSDVATARVARRRMEYRAGSTRLDGPSLPPRLVLAPIGLGLVGLFAVAFVSHVWTHHAGRPRARSAPRAVTPHPAGAVPSAASR